MPKKTYTTWGLKSEKRPHCLVEGIGPIRFANGQIDPECEKLFWTIEVNSEEEAKAVYYLRQGWAPFIPSGEGTDCPHCGEVVYRSESGHCWNCDHQEDYVRPKTTVRADFSRLEKWLTDNCNGDWEHAYGLRIETLDNPGWKVEIDLAGTKYDGLEFAPVSKMSPGEDTDDWIHCTVTEHKFSGFGGPEKLETIVGIFLNWIENVK